MEFDYERKTNIEYQSSERKKETYSHKQSDKTKKYPSIDKKKKGGKQK